MNKTELWFEDIVGQNPYLHPAFLNQRLAFAGDDDLLLRGVRILFAQALKKNLDNAVEIDSDVVQYCRSILDKLASGSDVYYHPVKHIAGIRIPASSEQNTSEFRNGFGNPELL